MLRCSDVHKRLPRFREALTSLENVRKKGGFENVPQGVLDRLEGLEPAGLNHKGQLVLPRRYDHLRQPPVVMLLPHEVGRTVVYTATSPVIRAANHILRLSGVETEIPRECLALKYKTPDWAAWMNRLNIHTGSIANGAGEYSLSVPRTIYIAAGVGRSLLGAMLVHEADHWDFYSDEAPGLQSRPGQQLTPLRMRAVAEKRAYALSYRMERSMGNYSRIEPIDVLAERYSGVSPTHAEAIYDDLTARRRAAGIGRPITTPLAALTFTHLFGDPTQLVTDAEITAFRAVELI